MSYKLSKFNITIPLEDSNEIILFNSLKCSFVVLDKDTQGFLHDINEIDKYDEDTIYNLRELGYIINQELDENDKFLKDAKNARLTNDLLSITIATTLDCNMACNYCFIRKNKQYLTEDVADKIISFAKKRLQESEFKKLQITWTGGEPLLNTAIIEYISKPLISMCEYNKIDYHATIITNGLLLSSETAKFLVDMKIRECQVTIDGLEATHNIRRPAIDKSSSFQTIIKNINQIYDYIVVVIRINIDKKNKDEIKDLLFYLHSTLDYQNNDRVWITLANVNGCSESFQVKEYLDFYREIYDNYMIDSNTKKYYPSPLNYACGAQIKDSYVIDPTGYVYKCWEEVGIKEYSIGTVDELHDDCSRSQKFLNDTWPESCNECKYLPMCHGGCPIRKWENNNTPVCIPESNTLDKYLKGYYKIWSREMEDV